MDVEERAIQAALNTGVPVHKGYIREIIDAVAPRDLAILARDRGGLIHVVADALDSAVPDTYFYYIANPEDPE